MHPECQVWPWPWLTGSSGGPRSVQGQLWELQLDRQSFVVPSPLHSALKYFVFFTSLQILSKY